MADHAAALLVAAREEIARADAKSAVLLATAGVALGAVLGGILAGAWSPYELDNRVEWLWWLGTAGMLVAVTALAAAVYPRGSRSADPGAVAYFGDVAAHHDPAALATALRAARNRHPEQLVVRLWQVARIARVKYRLIRVGMWAVAASGSLGLVVVLVSGALRSSGMHRP